MRLASEEFARSFGSVETSEERFVLKSGTRYFAGPGSDVWGSTQREAYVFDCWGPMTSRSPYLMARDMAEVLRQDGHICRVVRLVPRAV